MTYKGYLVEEIDGSYVGSVKDIDIPEINDGNVLIKVNYRVALCFQSMKVLSF